MFLKRWSRIPWFFLKPKALKIGYPKIQWIWHTQATAQAAPGKPALRATFSLYFVARLVISFKVCSRKVSCKLFPLPSFHPFPVHFGGYQLPQLHPAPSEPRHRSSAAWLRPPSSGPAAGRRPSSSSPARTATMEGKSPHKNRFKTKTTTCPFWLRNIENILNHLKTWRISWIRGPVFFGGSHWHPSCAAWYLPSRSAELHVLCDWTRHLQQPAVCVRQLKKPATFYDPMLTF